MKYWDFRVEIVPARGGGYVAHVTSPRGEGQTQFVPPFGPEDSSLTEALRVASGRHLQEGGGEADQSPEEIGKQLSAAFFQGEVLRLYERSLDVLADDPDAGLRLEVMLDPRDPGVAPLQGLPWELLHQPGTPEFLALSRRRPIVRYLAVPRTVTAAPRPCPFRILVVAPSPQGLPALHLARERRNLAAAVGTAEMVFKIVEAPAPTLAGLREALLAQECHAVHFMGHGGQLPGERDKVLFFTAPDGRAQPVSGTDLANKLADFPSVRLVVLNACETAAVSRIDPFLGAAGSLVLAGLPAVLAMRLPVSDEAAILFSRAFYQRLAAGDPVDAAAAEGRQEVHSAGLPGAQWAIPALFMRTPNGELFPEQDIPSERLRRGRNAPWLLAGLLFLALLGMIGFAAWRSRVNYLLGKGVEAAQEQDLETAAARFHAAFALAPHSPEVLANLADIEERVGENEKAEEHYRLAAQKAPESADHLYNLGHFLNRRKSYREAYQILDKALSLDPSRREIYGELAHAAMDSRALTEARKVLRDGLTKFPRDPTLHRLLGDLALRQGNAREALGELESSWEIYPLGDRGRQDTAALMIQASDALGDRPSTCRAVEEYLRLCPREAMPSNIEQIAARRGCLSRP